jgi:hypothetical protein
MPLPSCAFLGWQFYGQYWRNFKWVINSCRKHVHQMLHLMCDLKGGTLNSYLLRKHHKLHSIDSLSCIQLMSFQREHDQSPNLLIQTSRFHAYAVGDIRKPELILVVFSTCVWANEYTFPAHACLRHLQCNITTLQPEALLLKGVLAAAVLVIDEFLDFLVVLLNQVRCSRSTEISLDTWFSPCPGSYCDPESWSWSCSRLVCCRNSP